MLGARLPTQGGWRDRSEAKEKVERDMAGRVVFERSPPQFVPLPALLPAHSIRSNPKPSTNPTVFHVPHRVRGATSAASRYRSNPRKINARPLAYSVHAPLRCSAAGGDQTWHVSISIQEEESQRPPNQPLGANRTCSKRTSTKPPARWPSARS